MPGKFVIVRARTSNSRTGIPFSVTKRMQFDHITIDTSHGPWGDPALAPCLVVRWLI
jgi:hypothetical protein